MGCPFGACEGGIDKTVEACLTFNPIEFDGIKTGIVDLLPEAEEFDGVAIAQPVEDQVIGALRILVAGDVGQADIILVVDAGESNFAGEDFNFLAHGFSRSSRVA
jgi:hypothetical protein